MRSDLRKETKNCEYIFHLAALLQFHIAMWLQQVTLIQIFMGHKCNTSSQRIVYKRVIHTSTSETYGTAQFVPITEEHPSWSVICSKQNWR